MQRCVEDSVAALVVVEAVAHKAWIIGGTGAALLFLRHGDVIQFCLDAIEDLRNQILLLGWFLFR